MGNSSSRSSINVKDKQNGSMGIGSGDIMKATHCASYIICQ
jgi:hypothetical protein